MQTKLLATAALAGALCLGVAACDRSGTGGNAAAANAASTADDVKRVEQDMLAAWKARDAAKVASYYADDAVAALPGEPLQQGRDAIRKGVEGDLKDPGFSLDFTNADAQVSGDVAYTRGTFKVGYTDPKTKKVESMSGNYLTVFRKGGEGQWRAVEDFATAGPPEAPPAGG